MPEHGFPITAARQSWYGLLLPITQLIPDSVATLPAQ